MALLHHVDGLLERTSASPVALLLGTEPRAGFEVVDQIAGERLVLEGRHRFAVYRLTFRLHEDHGATTLTARTDAAFPGLGRIYRALVISSRFHVVAVRRLLSDVRARARSGSVASADP